MSAQADALLHQIQTLPAQDLEEFSKHFMAWFRKTSVVTADEDSIRSARGMFAGSRLNEALLAARAEDRSRE